MPRPSEIQNILEEAVAEVLEAALPGIRAEIVRRASKELENLFPAPGSSPTDLLSGAIASIQDVTSQADILRQLLEGGARFAGRVALFVVKAGAANGWQAIGFEDNNAIKNLSLDPASSLLARAMQSRSPMGGATAEFDSNFMTTVSEPAQPGCQLLPLVVKDKVAALLYADSGVAPNGTLDASGLAALTRFAGLWLELSALRKAGVVAAEESPSAATAQASVASALSSPSASTTAAPYAPPREGAGGADDDLHRKAKRFAKLLVEEIKLYNQPKVAEGKQSRDLYDRLREDIEKSRATYDKRYGETAAASADYFNQELVRILADNDLSLMGASFPR
jgi:hypothetical protein